MSEHPHEDEAPQGAEAFTKPEPASVDQPATFGALMGKAPRTTTFPIDITDAEGNEVRVVIKMKAISSAAYDKLVAEHPPKKKNAGDSFDPDTFGPALLAKCLTQPSLSLDEAKQLWTSETWAGGEVVDLFNRAVALNMRGLNVPFNSGD